MSSTYLIFRNPGEIDIRALCTFGVSVKESNNPIGFFGTGFKYAVAILLREHQHITIFSGKTIYNFVEKPTTIRGKHFSIISLNNHELGFTTELGKTWKLWMAYREIYCNMLDEGGELELSSTLPSPKAGETMVILSGRKILETHDNKEDFILSSTPILSMENINIHRKESLYVFLRGINVGNVPYPGISCFTYDVLGKLFLTEDRLLKFGSQLREYVAKAILSSSDESFIKRTLSCSDGYMEHHIDFSTYTMKPSETFIKVATEIVNDHSLPINPSLCDFLFANQIKVEEPKELTLSPVEQKMLFKALAFAKSIGYSVDDYPIKAVETLGKGRLGMAKNSTIYITSETFSMGTKMLAGTLIEEYIHLCFGFLDETRGMQNYLLNKIVSLGEDLQGEPL